MKKITKLGITLAVMFLAAGVGASAQTVTAVNQTSGNTLPGQGGTDDPDYTFFGSYQPGGGNGSPELTDFTQIQPSGVFGGVTMPTINAPAGSIDSDGNPITTTTATGLITGEQFFARVPVDLEDFRVLSTAASAYSLSAFFGLVNNGLPNGDSAAGIDSSFTITLDDASGTQLSTDTLNTTDNNTSSTTGLFANFTLTGLVAGDVIHVIVFPGQAASNVQFPYVGGVGFTPLAVPEPSTYAMVLAGMGALVFFARRKLA